MIRSSFFKSTVNRALLAVAAAGVLLRLYRITANDFLFYDEGMYIGQNHAFLQMVAANPPKNWHEFWIICGLMFKAALMSPKSLWFFLLNLRAFVLGADAWYVSRLISAAAGLATVVLTYRWASRYYQSAEAGWLSAVVLCILPSHVFYSRLGMQESLSALLFLAALYAYTFSPRGISRGAIASGVLLAAVFFTNYRMIIAPVFVAAVAFLTARKEGQPVDWRKLVWCCVVYFSLIFGLGSLYGGANTYVTFGWMFHQADESGAYRHWINFLSFPYYLVALEGGVFGLLFLVQWFLVRKRPLHFFLPAVLAGIQMVLFSFAAEKGARYLCVVLPFAAIAVGVFLLEVKRWAVGRWSPVYPCLAAALMGSMLWTSLKTAQGRTDYGRAVAMVLAHDPAAKIMSTQPLVEQLYAPDRNPIVPLPPDPGGFVQLLRAGYRFVIIDPQVYISWTADRERFSPKLVPYLEALRSHAQPVAVLPHLPSSLLERFVLDHNQDLARSLDFLRRREGRGAIYIYELKP